MARIKPDLPAIPTIKTLEDADHALKRIAEAQRSIDGAKIDLDRQIEELKSAFQHATAEAAADVKLYSDALGRYAQDNRAQLFKDGKTVKRLFGSFGYRASTSLKMDKGFARAQLVGLLKEQGLAEYIRVKEEADVEKLRTCPPELLALVHARVASLDTFFVEIPDTEAARAQA